jgi:D-sedoheptulose 7-phosphate isomerase
MGTIALTGQDGGAVGRAADIHLNVPCEAAARVQEAHCTILHILCELVERELTGD